LLLTRGLKTPGSMCFAYGGRVFRPGNPITLREAS
jgi:hypothetical protein